MPEQQTEQRAGWDRVVTQLQEVRRAAGDPSYAEIAQRVVRLRVERGEAPAAARVARSTVYDAFRTGRTRVNVALLRDIAESLGVTPAEVDAWVAGRDRPEPVDVHDAPPPPPAAEVTLRLALLVAVGSLVLNVLGMELQVAFGLPVHLDMLGTAVAAIALGPWRGAAVGLATNVLGIAVFGWASIPFALVNVVGALLWGYGVRRWGLGRTLPRFLGLNLVVAVACSVVALLVIAVFFGPAAEASGSELLGGLLLGAPAWVAMVVSNLVTSVGDKVLSGFVALAVLGLLPLAVRAGLGDRLVGVTAVEPARIA